jgi:uncharacterized protein GlcG (DUF336 family)
MLVRSFKDRAEGAHLAPHAFALGLRRCKPKEMLMRRPLFAVLVLCPVVTFAQGVVSQKSLSLGLAKTIAEAALAECKTNGFATSVAVVDRAGQLMVLLRDENATAQTAEMSRRKAYTARMFRISTMEFQKRTAEPLYAAQRDVSEILALGGGVPIQIGDEVIGGVASSGSSQPQDDACARAGVAKVADLLKP